MKTLKIASWNLRTFGDPMPSEAALRGIAGIILNDLGADIVCIQEIQCGAIYNPTIGCPVHFAVVAGLDTLLALLRHDDPTGGWQYALSGVNNSEQAKSMRDAYAFFWKATPSASAKPHAAAPLQIALIQGPDILRLSGPNGDNFPGRRPAMAVFKILGEANQPPVPLALVTIHAATPCNTVGKSKNGPSAGRAILSLAKLTEIGGTYRKGSKGGWSNQMVQGAALPGIDTIFLGDCNYTMTKATANAVDVYNNLTTNYQPCVSTFDQPIATTYSSNPTIPFSGVSSYDNIFALKPHGGFVPAVTFDNTANSFGAFDFIARDARALGANLDLTRAVADEAAWYVCYTDAYRKQNAKPGISDHLPVFAQFNLGAGQAGNQSIMPTSGANNNCLFHALYGDLVNGEYVDADAPTQREEFFHRLRDAIINNFAAVRQNVLGAMVNDFQSSPAWQANAQLLLANPLMAAPVLDQNNPNDWYRMVDAYLRGILSGRMLYADEAALLAIVMDLTINLTFANGGALHTLTLNPGRPIIKNIYHFGIHFFRFNPA